MRLTKTKQNPYQGNLFLQFNGAPITQNPDENNMQSISEKPSESYEVIPETNDFQMPNPINLSLMEVYILAKQQA